MIDGDLYDGRDQAVLGVLASVITMASLGGPDGYANISWRDADSGLLLFVGASAPSTEEDPPRVETPLF